MFTRFNFPRLFVVVIGLIALAGCNFPGAEPITGTLPTYIPPTSTPPATSTPPPHRLLLTRKSQTEIRAASVTPAWMAPGR